MKLAGKTIEGPNTETIVIPRTDGRESIVFKAKAVLDYDDFDAACPRPTPPIRMLKGGIREANPEDPRFKAAIEDWGTKRMNWMVIKSLNATEGLEWDTVKLSEPNTWNKLDEEFKTAGFSSIEVGRIRQGVFVANCLDEAKLDEARESFLLSQRQPLETSSFLEDEPSGMPSGDAARDWDSTLPVSATGGTTATSGSKQAS